MAKQATFSLVIVFCAAVIAAVGFVFVPSLRAGNEEGTGISGAPGGGSQETVFSIRTGEAELRTLQAYIEVNGNIVTEQQVGVAPEVAGKLVSMKVDLGSTVRKGALLAEVDQSKPGMQYTLSPVYAPISGTVITTPVPVGSTVSTTQTLMTLSGTNALELEALIPEREVGQLQVGLKAAITLEAFPGETFGATVKRVSPVVDTISRTKKITLRFDQADRRINPGMFARIKLNTRTYPDVVTVPSEALVEVRGTTSVYVLVGVDQVSLREVSTGTSVDGELEIKSGLYAGDTVVVQGQQFLTDGAKVRVVNRRSGV
ncbi:MAG: efflux RND transporter periplasmic adaptor subunit [Treponema sp.]|jgi:multidrug efflux pump subunit AcrA (membrane-fusion protein)|nr:efflux RND transporter periplasmic adaptor subunit [Treponema sp.]